MQEDDRAAARRNPAWASICFIVYQKNRRIARGKPKFLVQNIGKSTNCNDNGGFCFEPRRLVQNPEILREFEHFLCKAAEFGSNWRENNGNPSEIRRVYVDLRKICMIPLARSIGCSALRFPVSVCKKWRKSGRFVPLLAFGALRCENRSKSRKLCAFAHGGNCRLRRACRAAASRFSGLRQSAHCGGKS